MDSSMKLRTLLLLATIPARLLAQTDTERLAESNRQADQFLASYDLDKAEALLIRALQAAARLGPSVQATARIKLYDLYVEFHKRDGRSWINIGLPHLLEAIALTQSGTHPGLMIRRPASEQDIADETVRRFHTRYASALIQMSRGQLGVKLSPFLKETIALLEARAGPIPVESALAYETLSRFPDRSPEQQQALNACDLLTGSSTPVPPDFATLLCNCADAQRRTGSLPEAIRLASAARLAASASGRRRAFETVLSYMIESDAEAASAHPAKALVAMDSALELARTALAPGHGFYERMLEGRASILDALHQRSSASEAKRELKTWLSRRDQRLQSGRVRIPKKITVVEQVTAVANAIVIISPEGKAKVLSTFQETSRDAEALATKAVAAWRFQPYHLDGNPVAGVTMYAVGVR